MIDVAAVIRKMTAVTMMPADGVKKSVPEITSAEMIRPLIEIMMLAFIAAREMRSSSARYTLRNIVSTAFDDPSFFVLPGFRAPCSLSDTVALITICSG